MADTTSSTSGISISSGNEINRKGIIISGVLFIFFTLLSIVALIAYWPDKLPQGNASAMYSNKPFNICLLDSTNQFEPSGLKGKFGFSKTDSILINSFVKHMADSTNSSNQNLTDSLKNIEFQKDSADLSDSLYALHSSFRQMSSKVDSIGLNTLLLILVGIAGFLGTMIHITSSFTNFVGAEKFKKSWVLWYVVKPFTGAALAIVLYFVFRAGLLNFNDTSSINLYGIITLAAFAGLFTDKATMKLAEVFEVMFRTVDPKTGKTDIRPDNLAGNDVNIKITGIKPDTLVASSDNNLVVSGLGLDKKRLTIKIDEEEIINPVIKSDSISLTYKIPDGSDKKEFLLQILDEKGNEVYSSKLTKSEETAHQDKSEAI